MFFLFAMGSPVIANLTPQILKLSGLDITMPEPQILDSYIQFFSNFNQIVMFALILTLASIVAREKSKGTFILLLSKGIKRRYIIYSKFLSAVISITVIYVFSVLLFLLYSYFFFDKAAVDNYALAFLSFYVYMIYIISFVVFSSTLANTTTQASLISLGIFFAGIGLNAIHVIRDFVPTRLSSLSTSFVVENIEPKEILTPLLSTIIIIILLMEISNFAFSKMEIKEI